MESIIKKLKRQIGYDIVEDTAVMTVERTVDPRILDVTINFKMIKHEIHENQ